MELLYRGNKDGMTAQNFHNKCDDKGRTICLCLNDKNNIFGGYSSIPWETMVEIKFLMIVFYLL